MSDQTEFKTKSQQIRELSAKGLQTADIARSLGIRYQHVYNVLSKTKLNSPNLNNAQISPKSETISKPSLTVEELTSAGFIFATRWLLTEDDRLILETALPKKVGVYCFVQNSVAQYVGVATMGLAKRIYFYGRPGVSQRTSLRLNELMRSELRESRGIEIYVAFPPDTSWNGLPVHSSAGLELGLIKAFSLPWNRRSAG